METKTINLRDLPEELVRRAKACAALHGMTLKAFVVEALKEATEKDIPASMAASALVSSRRKRKGK
jgi:plasmid stability protein